MSEGLGVVSARKRTCKEPKGPGYEYWSARPFNKAGGTLSPRGGKHHKRRTHKAERQMNKPARDDFDA